MQRECRLDDTPQEAPHVSYLKDNETGTDCYFEIQRLEELTATHRALL